MFGYIVLSSRASKEDKETYRECYCGLCHVLGKKYGRAGMMSLSYDMTFLALLLSDISSDEKTIAAERCAVHPVKKHRYFTTEAMNYSADMQILLSYYSSLDSIKDDGKGKRKAESLAPFIPSLEEKYPRAASVLKTNLEKIDGYEKRNEKDPEKTSLLFGGILGEVFTPDENAFFSSDLYLLGVSIGKFIYLLDGWDDRERDRKKGAYNPFDEKTGEEEIRSLLMDAAASASASASRLPISEYTSIIDDILYRGMWTRFERGRKR